jgi:hypothetical protein
MEVLQVANCADEDQDFKDDSNRRVHRHRTPSARMTKRPGFIHRGAQPDETSRRR